MKLALGMFAALPLFIATPALAEQVLYCFPNGQAYIFSGSDATGYSLNAAGACAGGPWVTVLELTAPVSGTGGNGPRRDRAAERALAQLSRVPLRSVAVVASQQQVQQMRRAAPRSTLKVRADQLPAHVARLLSVQPAVRVRD
jgi:hypothetical protein